MTPDAQPLEIALTEQKQLLITWSDGERREYAIRQLRDECPCAHCNAARQNPKPKPLLSVIDPREAAPLRIAALRPVGNYAYAIDFSDGHNSGIFTIEQLRVLGRVVE